MNIKNISAALIPVLHLTTTSMSMETAATAPSCAHQTNNLIMDQKIEAASFLMTEFISKFIINSKMVVPCDELSNNKKFSLARPKKIKNNYSSNFINSLFDTTYHTTYFIEKNKNCFSYYQISMDAELYNSFMTLLDLIEDDYQNITIKQLSELLHSHPDKYNQFSDCFFKENNSAPWIHGGQRQNLLHIVELNKSINVDVLWNKKLNKTMLLGKIIYKI